MESAQGFQSYLCYNSENNKNTEKKQNIVNQEGHKKHFWD